MQIVLPCSKRKKTHAPTFCLDGHPIRFIANPQQQANLWERAPWDPITHGNKRTWIHCLTDYNNAGQLNPEDLGVGVSINGANGLFCAGTLYAHRIYSDLIQVLGFDNVYILSAGWGLVRADTRLPTYNITFSTQAEQEARISVQGRLENPKCTCSDFANLPTTRVFAGRSYRDFLRNMINNHRYVEEPCNGRIRTWFYGAARQWVNQNQAVAPIHQGIGGCACNCNFRLNQFNCGQLPQEGHGLTVI